MCDPVIFLLGVLSQLPILPRSAHRGRGEAFRFWTTRLVQKIEGSYIHSAISNALLDNILDMWVACLFVRRDDPLNPRLCSCWRELQAR